MYSDIAIKIEKLSKRYQIYEQPRDRLKQFILPNIQRMIGCPPKNYFRDFWALKDVTFEIKKGETVGIIGRNGSGKSTLLQMICGTLNPTSGNIQTNGRIAALLELGSGFNPEFTGRENVYMNATVLGLNKEEIDDRFDRIAAFADIGDYIDQPTRTYSSGMYVRLAFSVAVNVSPDILIVDEALAVGDIRFQVKCHKVFEQFKQSGKTMVLVSHSSNDIVRLCSKSIWLDGGKKRQEGSSKAMIEAYHAEMVHNVGIQHSKEMPDLQKHLNQTTQSLVALPTNATITGEGGVSILAVGLLDEAGNPLITLDGEKKVRVEFVIKTSVMLVLPFFAFQVVNSKGLRVLGSNTFVQGKSIESIEPNKTIHISFAFDFPELENGEYLVAIGIGDGTPTNHVRLAFVSDAYSFVIISDSLQQTQSILIKLPRCTSNIKIT
jgi:lipopolysaccharide transport system ATP-binding protein